MSFKRPVAQNWQARLQPICEEIQAVVLLFVGINTPSTILLSAIEKAHFTVLSLLIC